MKVPWTTPAPTTIFPTENIFQNFIRLARERKQMSDVEQNRQGLGVFSLFLVLGHVKLISTLTEAKIMGLINALITAFETEDLQLLQEVTHEVLSNCCVMLPFKFKSMVLGMLGE